MKCSVIIFIITFIYYVLFIFKSFFYSSVNTSFIFLIAHIYLKPYGKICSAKDIIQMSQHLI